MKFTGLARWFLLCRAEIITFVKKKQKQKSRQTAQRLNRIRLSPAPAVRAYIAGSGCRVSTRRSHHLSGRLSTRAIDVRRRSKLRRSVPAVKVSIVFIRLRIFRVNRVFRVITRPGTFGPIFTVPVTPEYRKTSVNVRPRGPLESGG